MKRRFFVLLLVILGIPRCSCHGSAPGGRINPASDAGTDTRDPNGARTLRILPSTITLDTDGTNPAMTTFKVISTRVDTGAEQDVTSGSIFALANPALGSMNGPLFVSNLIGGSSMLTATNSIDTATAAITVKVVRVATQPPPPGQNPLPMDPGTVFGNAPMDPARAPRIVYPNDGVLVPSNLNQIEIHFRKGADDNTLFEISFESAFTDVKVYTRCQAIGAGCVYNTDPAVWSAIAMTNRGGAPIDVVVRGTNDQASGVGTSAPVKVGFSAAPLYGGLYYWTTSNGTGILRVDFGASQQTPQHFFPFSGGGCYGCHALSRNGKRMSLSTNGIGDGRITLLDVGSTTIFLTNQDDKRAQFQSWNPTSDRFAGVWSDDSTPTTDILVRDGMSGNVMETIPIGAEPDHPDWSPLGDRIAFTVVTYHHVSQRPGRGGISYIQQMPGASWSAPIQLMPAADGINRYYPAYAPDARFLVFDESHCPSGQIYAAECDADSDFTAKIWAIPTDGGTPILLARANAPGIEDGTNVDITNTFPKWAPFVDPLRADGTGRVMWLTFSSRRQYGLRQEMGTNLLIWMVAIDPDAIMAGKDGSYPAFALPFQELTTSNHIAQWTARVVPMGGDDGGVPDPGHGSDGGGCLSVGEMCDPNNSNCCVGDTCSENGPGIFLCKPAL
jgi:hypothetical protein